MCLRITYFVVLVGNSYLHIIKTRIRTRSYRPDYWKCSVVYYVGTRNV